jgi:hypothetical protein
MFRNYFALKQHHYIDININNVKIDIIFEDQTDIINSKGSIISK